MLPNGTHVNVIVNGKYLYSGIIDNYNDEEHVYLVRNNDDWYGASEKCVFEVEENPNHATPADTHIDDTLHIDITYFEHSSTFVWSNYARQTDPREWYGVVDEIHRDYVVLRFDNCETWILSWEDVSHVSN